MNEKTNLFVEILRNNIVQITFALMGITGLALGSYITLRLSPIIESVDNLAQKVNALETKSVVSPEKFAAHEEKVNNILENTQEIKARQIRFDEKLDRYI